MAEGLKNRGKAAVWVGGTGLYHRVLTGGLAKAPGTDRKVAAELEAMSTAELAGEIGR
ncbi:MAG: tRNA (adenosine(37)-N6)-dimethylallyltransferase MiaA, partial [Verrucomicrobia bacterium]|nr:tRNA (adenosine(37)-N6)-dimethylallyltransferase MiaA [Verrucomicrobiota bacterium]